MIRIVPKLNHGLRQAVFVAKHAHARSAQQEVFGSFLATYHSRRGKTGARYGILIEHARWPPKPSS